jgi:choline dehydrogenase-like flavoprotein
MWKKEYDFIIIGSGSAGSLIVNRLAQEQDYRVLLLEAGGNENFLSEIPALSISLHQTSLDWGYVTEPQANACLGLQNRQSRWPRGRVIGGSSAMDYMLYFNGNPNDFNEWERNGAKGWSWSDVRQHFPIVESDDLNVRLSKEDIQHQFEEKVENSLTVPTSLSRLTRAFIQSGSKLNYSSVRLNTRSKIGFSVLLIKVCSY